MTQAIKHKTEITAFPEKAMSGPMPKCGIESGNTACLSLILLRIRLSCDNDCFESTYFIRIGQVEVQEGVTMTLDNVSVVKS